MVTRAHEGKLVFLEKNTRFVIALDFIKFPEIDQIMCLPNSELPSTISTMRLSTLEKEIIYSGAGLLIRPLRSEW